MSCATDISLEFPDSADPRIRARITYAFRVFAAIYNYRVVEPGAVAGSIRCSYGAPLPRDEQACGLAIPALYRIRSETDPLPKLSRHRFADETFWLTFGVEKTTGKPDWLGELFEWIASGHERPVQERDAVGRIPYSRTVFGRQHISPQKPYASMIMAWLENALRHGRAREALPKAPCPMSGVDHAVICTHDVDYYYTNKKAALFRIAKNLGIAVRPYRSWSFFASNARLMADLFKGKHIGDYLPPLLRAGEEYGFKSTVFVVSRIGHRRDPNYNLTQVAPHLREAAQKGFSVAVHGSYTSAIGAQTLAAEASALAAVAPARQLGNRQHWLRFGRHERLFEQLEQGGFLFDSTLGFPDRAGFRNGASFAFPPYDFSREKPHNFLEFPLVLMDGNVEATCRATYQTPQQVADDVLAQSRRWGWGGIAALWHNPLEPIQVPEEVNRVFWTCAKQQERFREKWMSASHFLAQSLGRYHNAGLLEGVRLDA